MIPNHAQFLDAIREMKLVRIEFYSKADGGTVDRECAPLDYGPDAGAEEEVPLNRYWIWDFTNTSGSNPRGVLPDEIVKVDVLGKNFEPSKIILVPPRPWTVQRNWQALPGVIDSSVKVEDVSK